MVTPDVHTALAAVSADEVEAPGADALECPWLEPGGEPAPAHHADGQSLPRIPASEVIRFRADAWRWLSPEDFARVDACYTEGLRTAERWLTEHLLRPPDDAENPRPGPEPPSADGRRARTRLGARLSRAEGEPVPGDTPVRRCKRASSSGWVEHEALQLMLSELTATSPSPRHTIARLRGAQAGFLRQNLLLELPAGLARLTGPGLGRVTFTDEVAERIRARVAHPVAAATLAVAAFTGLDHGIIRGVLPEALAADGTVLRVPPLATHGPDRPASSVAYFVPPAARGLLRAALAFHDQRDRPARYLLGHVAAATTIAAFHAAAEACNLPAPTDPRPGAATWLSLADCHEISSSRRCRPADDAAATPQHPRTQPTANPPQTPRLDIDLVVSRARALGLDDNDFTRHIGVSLADVELGLHPCMVTLDLIGRLCQLLDVETTDLIATSTPAPAPRRRARPNAPSDHRWSDTGTVAAVLLALGPLNPDELATALGWSYRRLARATNDLTDDLADQPVALVEDNQTDGTLTLTVRPNALRAGLRERLDATRFARAVLEPGEASSLLRLVGQADEPVDDLERRTEVWTRLAPDQRRAIHAGLARRGLANPSPTSGPVTPPVPHQDVLFALDLAPEPAAVSPTAPPRTRRRHPPS